MRSLSLLAGPPIQLGPAPHVGLPTSLFRSRRWETQTNKQAGMWGKQGCRHSCQEQTQNPNPSTLLTWCPLTTAGTSPRRIAANFVSPEEPRRCWRWASGMTGTRSPARSPRIARPGFFWASSKTCWFFGFFQCWGPNKPLNL